MRSYGQLCALAKALDAVGDRWSLLIVRELLLRDEARYTDLQRGLPGIATNLLADRLRALEDAGVIARAEAPPPVAAAVFSLTERGRALEPVLLGLADWGAPLFAAADGDEEFRSRWMALPLRRRLAGRGANTAVEIRTGEEPLTIEAAGGAASIRPGYAEDPAAVVEGPPKVVLGYLTGWLDEAAAERHGLRLTGDRRAIDRVLDRAQDDDRKETT